MWRRGLLTFAGVCLCVENLAVSVVMEVLEGDVKNKVLGS